MTRFPPKKILVPFDLSSLSEAAWARAVALADRFKAQLEVLHVRQGAASSDSTPLAPPRLSIDAKRKLLARIREKVGRVSKVTLTTGDPAGAVVRFARAGRADLIVMGTHGRTGIKRALLGSVTEAVARNSPVPVLAVRGEAGPIRSILAPVNFTEYSYYGFTYAATLAAGLNARLTALHVHLDPIWSGDPRRKLAALLDGLPAPLREASRPLVETGAADATRGILKAADGHDLIVLVAHENSRLKELVLGTTAERVLRRSRASVLVVPAPLERLTIRKDLPTPCCAAA